MKKIRQILKEETSDPFSGVPNEILFDFLQDFEEKFDYKKAVQFCKYLSVNAIAENISFFDELINLNPSVEYEVIFEVKEKLWVKYETITSTFGYNEKSVDEQISNGDIGCFDGHERPNSREIYDSELLEENAYILDDKTVEPF